MDLQLRRWYLGLHGLALLRGWPFGSPEEAQARIQVMHELLDAGDPETAGIDVLDVDHAYEDWAATYDEPNPLIFAEERAMREVLDTLAPGRAADIACGTGRVASALIGLGHATVAVDRSSAMLARAHRNAPNAAMVQADLLRLPLCDGGFDVVTCALALTHVSDLQRAMAELSRLLRPEGVLVVSDISPFAAATGGHAFFRREDDTQAVARNEVHWPSRYIEAGRTAGLVVERCTDVLVDEEILREFGVGIDPLEPLRAVEGLPFASVWVFRAPDGLRSEGPFAVGPREMRLQPGLDVDDVQGLLDQVEGPGPR